MRLGRLILAGLAPLIGLSALLSPDASGVTVTGQTGAHLDAHTVFSLWLQSVAQMVAPGAESGDAVAHFDGPAAQTLVSFPPAPARHALWMIRASATPVLLIRPERHILLRC